MSPDYVLLPRSVAPEFYEAIKHYYAEFFPTDLLAPESSWSKIVNARHYKRIQNLLDNTKGTIMLGGKGDGVRLEPTIVKDVALDDPLMLECVHLFVRLVSVFTRRQRDIWTCSCHTRSRRRRRSDFNRGRPVRCMPAYLVRG